MYMVNACWKVGNYNVLTLNKDLPLSSYTKCRIEGKEYKLVPTYDLPKSIVIKGNGDYEGKRVEFVL